MSVRRLSSLWCIYAMSGTRPDSKVDCHNYDNYSDNRDVKQHQNKTIKIQKMHLPLRPVENIHKSSPLGHGERKNGRKFIGK